MMDNLQKSIQKRNLMGRKRGRVLSIALVLILLFANLPLLESNAMSTTKLETVYIDGVNGKDTNSGKSKDLSVSTFNKAKELLSKNGTIIVIGNLYISSEEKWSLPMATYGSAVVKFVNEGTSDKSFGANIQVKSSGSLTLENITLVGSTDILIFNSGTVKVNTNTVIKNGADIVNMAAIQTLAGGTTMQSETEKESETEAEAELLTESVEEEKKSNLLVIERDDLIYGEEVTPVVSQNPGQGEVAFVYKVQGAPDRTYTSEEPTKIGYYTVKAVSIETLEYQSESVTVDFEIKKAVPDEIVFPTAGEGEESSVLATVLLTDGSGAGTFTWLDGSERLQADNDGYIVIFTPNDTYNYDYANVKGYDSESETVRQPVSVTVNPVASETDIEIGQATEVTTEVTAETKGKESETAAETKIKETEEATETEVKKTETLTTESHQTEAPAHIEKTEQTNAIDMQTLENSKVQISAETTKTVNAIKSLPKEITNIDGVNSVILVTNIYEALSAGNKAQISEGALQVLSKAQAMAGEFNHISNGVTVTGGDIPWYVQLRVLVKSKSEYAEMTDLKTVILPYEIKLWNLMTQSEYKLEDDREATITIPLAELEGYTDIKVVHYEKDGTFEYIIPSFDGGTMSFVTTSFSPFDIGGSEELVGKASSDNETETAASTKGTEAVTETEMTTTAGTSSSAPGESSSNSNSSSTSKTRTGNKIPTTGDYAPIIALAALVVVSGILIVVLVLKKKKR